MAKADIDYPKLAELLKEKGINETRENLANKINRGKFSFAFAIAILDVLGVVIDRQIKKGGNIVIIQIYEVGFICKYF